MTDHKFTDDEIIKALECCRTIDGNDCEQCPYHGRLYPIGSGGCFNSLVNDALALINRQKAEIERLQAVHADMTESLRLASEANKDMSVELDAMRGAANSYKMHYEEAQAEIERLKKIGDDKTSEVLRHDASIRELHKQLETARSEAIKEFAWRLKKKMYPYNGVDKKTYAINAYAVEKAIEDLVKEMMENDK